MIAPAPRITYKRMANIKKVAMSQIKQEAIDLAQPLVEAAAYAAQRTRRRVVTTGAAGDGGRFSRYAPGSGKRGTKNFYESGTMWNSLQVKLQNPTRAVAGFTGKAAVTRMTGAQWRALRKKRSPTGRRIKRRSWTNNMLGRTLQFKEKKSIIGVATRDLADMQTLLRMKLSEEVVQRLQWEMVRFKADRKGRSMDRKAKRAMRDLGRRR